MKKKDHLNRQAEFFSILNIGSGNEGLEGGGGGHRLLLHVVHIDVHVSSPAINIYGIAVSKLPKMDGPKRKLP